MRGRRGSWLLCSLLFVAPSTTALPVDAAAQTPETPDPAGHWEGSILIPDTPLGIDIDLVRAPDGVWSGDISIPAQLTEDYPLADVTVSGRDVSFRMADVPGDPMFTGTLSEDGTTLSGRFTQGGAVLEFRLTRKVG